MEYSEKEKNIYIYESFCYTPKTNTTVEINYTSIKKKMNNLIEKWAKDLNTSSKRRYRWQVST